MVRKQHLLQTLRCDTLNTHSIHTPARLRAAKSAARPQSHLRQALLPVTISRHPIIFLFLSLPLCHCCIAARTSELLGVVLRELQSGQPLHHVLCTPLHERARDLGHVGQRHGPLEHKNAPVKIYSHACSGRTATSILHQLLPLGYRARATPNPIGWL